MKYYEWLLKRKVPCFPFRLWKHDKKNNDGEYVILADGQRKQQKTICSETFGHVEEVYSYYGEELGKYLCEHNLTKDNQRQLHDPSFKGREAKDGRPAVGGYNPELALRKIAPATTDFDFPEHLLKQYIDAKWRGYKNGNDKGYTHIAVDTLVIGCVDIDCVLDKDSPFVKLMNTLPNKKSNSKSFGRHILYDRTDIPRRERRIKENFPDKYGLDKSGKSGLEHLNGLWEWSAIDAEIENPDADMTPEPWFKEELLKMAKAKKVKKVKKQGETKEPTDAPPVVNGIPQISNEQLNNLMRNINHFPVEQMAKPQVWGGIIATWSISKNEDVFNILHLACKREGAKYGGEQPIRDKWEQGCPFDRYDHYAYNEENGFFSYWCKRQEYEFPWNDFMDDDDKMVQERFIQNHSNNFIINNDYKKVITKLCYFDEKTKLWEHDPKVGIGKSVIHNLLLSNEYNYWKKFMEESIEKIEDEEFKEACIKFKKKHLKKYHSTGNWISGCIKNIYNMLYYNKKLQKEVQFNLMPTTTHLFQFRNGAYNFKTGQLEERKRDMYITSDGYLKYDFPENEKDEDYADEMVVIADMLAKCLPNPVEREAWCAWRGYCLTGEINAQMFFIYLGAGAGGGKSKMCEIFSDAFPVYVKLLGKDAVIDKCKDDKSLSSLVNKAYRILYIEELEELGLKVKQLTQQNTTVKPLYMEEIDLVIQFKLEGLCNAVPRTKTDEGVLRRARQIEFNSKFVDEEDDVDEADHIYLKDANLADKFKYQIRWKIALFRYFAKYSKKFYDDGVNEWKKQFEDMREAFQDTNQDDDALAEFVKCFEKSEDDDDCISKADMLTHLYSETGDEFIKTDNMGNIKYKKFTNVRNEFKKHRYKYDGSKRQQINMVKKKGFFTNIKWVGNMNDDEDEEEEY